MGPAPDGGASGTAIVPPGGGTRRPDFTLTITLEGGLVRLVPATRDHAATLHDLLADPELARLTGSVHASDAGPGGGASRWTGGAPTGDSER